MATTDNQEQKVSRKDIYSVPFLQLAIVPDFNLRIDMGDLKELAASIAENGIKVPMRGYKKDGLYYITDGHRRYEAMKYLHKKGYSELEAMFICEPKGYTEEQRTLDIILANDGKKLSLLEEAYVFDRMRGFGWTVKEIAKGAAKSTTHVDNCLNLLNAPVELLDRIIAGELSASLVIEQLRKKDGKDVVKLVQAAEEDLEAKGSKRTKITAKDLEEKKPRRNISKDLTKMLDEVKEESAGDHPVNEENLLFAERLLQYYNGELDYEDVKAMFFLEPDAGDNLDEEAPY